MYRSDLEGSLAAAGRKRRFAAPSAVAILIGLAAAGLAQRPAQAADDQQLQLLEDQIRQLQAQIDSLKKTQTADEQKQLMSGSAIGSNQPAYGYMTGSHQFGWVSADGKNSIELTGRLHFDVGDYLSIKPNHAFYPGDVAIGTPGHSLDSGVNARRARIGVTGKFLDDFNYTLIYDFGGSSDSFGAGTGGTNNTASNSGIENAYITYNGFNKADDPVPVAIDVGYLDVPWTIDEAMSSNDMPLLEHPSPEVIFTSYWGGNDNRAALGARSYKTDYFAGAWITGPQTGNNHTFAFTDGVESSAVLARGGYNPIQTSTSSLHIGGNLGYVTSSPQGFGITPGDRPELRIDPTKIVGNAGAIPVKTGAAAGIEAAGAFDQFFVMGEYYFMDFQQRNTVALGNVAKGGPHPDLNFTGGYGVATYAIGGRRTYSPANGTYTGVIPDKNFSFSEGGGAWEFAMRGSYIDMNSNFTPLPTTIVGTGGYNGGKQIGIDGGVTFYFNTNIRIMLDYVHTDISDLYTNGISTKPTGTTIDAIAGRFQVAW
jgi:phosphate-selective porin OprO/OprP